MSHSRPGTWLGEPRVSLRVRPCTPVPGHSPGIDDIPRAQFHHLFKPHGKYVSRAVLIWGKGRS